MPPTEQTEIVHPPSGAGEPPDRSPHQADISLGPEALRSAPEHLVEPVLLLREKAEVDQVLSLLAGQHLVVLLDRCGELRAKADHVAVSGTARPDDELDRRLEIPRSVSGEEVRRQSLATFLSSLDG